MRPDKNQISAIIHEPKDFRSGQSLGIKYSPVFIKVSVEASIDVVLGLIFLLICFSPANIMHEY